MNTWHNSGMAYPTEPNEKMFLRTAKILGRFGLDVTHAVAIKEENYYSAPYVRTANKEIVFVIPKRPAEIMQGTGSDVGATARAVMAAVPFGM